MITNPTDEANVQAKNEEQKIDDRVSSRAVPSSSRHWTSFRNPRIVRVSGSFGGKDRHSKVCTIRGLRDRRIRLSVPTAIQLYDLQDKLGLNQPSKVIDWLLEATKQDIDNFPPLQIPQGFGHFHQHIFGDYNMGSRNLNDLLLSHEPSTSQFSLSPFFPIRNSIYARKHGVQISDNVDVDDEVDDTGRTKSSKYWDIDLGLRPRNNEALQRGLLNNEKGKSIEMNDVLDKNAGISDHHYAQLSAHNFFPSLGYSSLPSGSTSNLMPYSYNHLDPSHLSLSQFGGFQHQMAEHSSSISSAIYPLTLAAPSLLPTYPPYFTASSENDSRQQNQFQFLSSNMSQPIVSSTHLSLQQRKPFQTNSYTKFLHPHSGTHTEGDDHEEEPS